VLFPSGGGRGSGGVNGYNVGNVASGGGDTVIYGEGTEGGAKAIGSDQHSTNIQGYRGSEEGPGGGGGPVKTKNYGGGGAGNEDDGDDNGADGGSGAVRIIWGPGRSYPATLTKDQTTIP